MRELNECTAEVFRRSEKRIKERKRNRNRVLALCVPVILIAAVWSAMSLPGMMPEGGTLGNDRFTGESAGNAPESVHCPYTSAEIQEAGRREEVTDRPAVAELFDAVDSLFAEAAGNGQQINGNLPAEETNGNQNLTDSAGSPKTCTITFTAEDGSRAMYRLSGNTLVNAETTETIILSDSQIAGLLSALGLTE